MSTLFRHKKKKKNYYVHLPSVSHMFDFVISTHIFQVRSLKFRVGSGKKSKQVKTPPPGPNEEQKKHFGALSQREKVVVRRNDGTQ